MENDNKSFTKNGKYLQFLKSQPDEKYFTWIKQIAVPMVKETIEAIRRQKTIDIKEQNVTNSLSSDSQSKNQLNDLELLIPDGMMSFDAEQASDEIIAAGRWVDMVLEYDNGPVVIPCLIKNPNTYQQDGFMDCEIVFLKDNSPTYHVKFKMKIVALS